MNGMKRWKGKIAVVTGASSGIGSAIARSLADNGLIVVALARRAEKLREVADSTTGKIYPRVCDLTKEENILSSFRWIEEHLGGVDILVNNAAVCKLVSLIDGESSQWIDVMKTNVHALNVCTREALKTMRQRGDDGNIIHLNSVAGHQVPAFHSLHFGIYSASKHALTALTEALRIELQGVNSKIRVSSISPGAVNTDMLNSITQTEEVVAQQEGGEKYLVAEDIADAVIFIISRRPIVQIQDVIIQPVGQIYA